MKRPTKRNDLIVWRLLDGRAGHENQVLGLSDAMGRLQTSVCFDIRIDHRSRGFRSILPGRLRMAESLPAPDLLIAAGHGTHLPLLRLQRRFGGRSVVIMKPSLPTRCFDACLIPFHDELSRHSSHVIMTEGTVNRIRPEDRRAADCVVILVGGPSRHFEWSNEQILLQIREIVQRSSLPHLIATSQRTPATFRTALLQSGLDLPVRDSGEFDAAWIANALSHSESVWVTCDSMSMTYEAITCGAGVGLLELPVARTGRLSRNIERLAQRQIITRWSDWSTGTPLKSRSNFSESDRCAKILLERFGLCEAAPMRPLQPSRQPVFF